MDGENKDEEPTGRRQADPRVDDLDSTGVYDSLEDFAFIIDQEARSAVTQGETIRQNIGDIVSATAQGMRACLVVLVGARIGEVFDLGSEDVVLGRAMDVTIPLDDSAASRRHAKIHSSPLGYVITDLGSKNGMLVNGKRVDRHLLRDGDRIQIGSLTVLKFAYEDGLEGDLRKRLRESATRDPLTGLYNKAFFLEALRSAFSEAIRRKRALSLMVIDIDRFKDINDKVGHLGGDRVLAETALRLRAQSREADLLARFGGDEFVVLLRETDEASAMLGAIRLRTAVSGEPLIIEGAELPITLSIGLATLLAKNFTSPANLFRGADSALLEAKRLGRDRISVSTSGR